jgi:hypothetical protein
MNVGILSAHYLPNITHHQQVTSDAKSDSPWDSTHTLTATNIKNSCHATILKEMTINLPQNDEIRPLLRHCEILLY